MKIDLYETEKAVSLEIIDETAKSMSVSFPEEYITFLLDQNGGYPKVSEFDFSDGSNSSVVNYFYSIGDMEGNLKRKHFIFDGDIPEGFITIGCDSGGNQILLRVDGENIGEIYFWVHDVDPDEENNMYFLANSLNTFLKMLK